MMVRAWSAGRVNRRVAVGLDCVSYGGRLDIHPREPEPGRWRQLAFLLEDRQLVALLSSCSRRLPEHIALAQRRQLLASHQRLMRRPARLEEGQSQLGICIQGGAEAAGLHLHDRPYLGLHVLQAATEPKRICRDQAKPRMHHDGPPCRSRANHEADDQVIPVQPSTVVLTSRSPGGSGSVNHPIG